jgi:ribosomal protein L11 methyltransferase
VPPNPKTYVARLATRERDGRQIADRLTEILDPANAVCASVEVANGAWQVEVHFAPPLNAAAIRSAFALATGRSPGEALHIEPLQPRDWIAQSLAGLAPVHAGRFIVHGAHDRTRVPINRIGIEIEAALAFGTGHHGTTRGCLLALDSLLKCTRPRRVLDLGTGSGVLAIAAAKTLRRHVLATDIDRRAVRAAHENVHNNRVGSLVETVRAAGLHSRDLARRAPFDLVLANILLDPLQRMAASLATHLAPRASVILSGLLPSHGNAATAAYRAQGLALKRRISVDGWVTLVMQR